jgi:hypothetical protein
MRTIQSAESSLQNDTTHSHELPKKLQPKARPTCSAKAHTRTRRRTGVYSVGPELTRRTSHFARAPQQNSSVAETPPEADHHRGPTRVAHRPRGSTKEARPGEGTEQALPMIAEEPPPSQPSESLVLWTPRRCLQEENDTGVPPPPDPRI